jgi:hypothetical protein
VQDLFLFRVQDTSVVEKKTPSFAEKTLLDKYNESRTSTSTRLDYGDYTEHS